MIPRAVLGRQDLKVNTVVELAVVLNALLWQLSGILDSNRFNIS